MSIIGILLYLMLGPAPAAEASAPGIDKVAHFVAFGTIAGCLTTLFPRRRLTWISAAAVMLGGAVELLQGQVGRDPSWFDFLADAIGVAVYAAIVLTWRAARRNYRPR